MTAFILAHTAITLLPVGLGLYAFSKFGRIDPNKRSGRWYIGTMIAGAVSGLGFIATLGFTPGQVLGLLTLAMVLIGAFTLRGRVRQPGYVQTISLTTSYLMLWVFLTTEFLKHFPSERPFASGPADPALIPIRLGLLAVYLAVLGRQLWSVHSDHVFDFRVRRFLHLAML